MNYKFKKWIFLGTISNHIELLKKAMKNNFEKVLSHSKINIEQCGKIPKEVTNYFGSKKP